MEDETNGGAEGSNPVGRPPIVFDEMDAVAVEALAAFLNQTQIANYFGMSERRFRDLMKRQDEISSAYKKGKSRAIANVGGSLLTKALSGDVTAMIFYLKTQAGWKEGIDLTSGGEALFPDGIRVVPAKRKPKDEGKSGE